MAKIYRYPTVLLLIFTFENGLALPPIEPDEWKQIDGINVGICSEIHQCHEFSLEDSRCGMAPTDVDECGCDSACEYYGDCCYDYSTACKPKAFSAPTTDANLLQCVGLNDDDSYGYYVVGLCKDDSSVDIDTIEKCEQPGADDILLKILVSDADDSIYRNVYCALCNDVPMTEVKAWTATFICDDDELRNQLVTSTTQQPLSLPPNKNKPADTLPPSIHEQIGDALGCAYIKFQPPTGKEDTRRICNSEARSSCDREYLNECVIKACDAKYKAVVYKDGGVYKNPHCAMCNNEVYYVCGPGVKNKYQGIVTPLTVIVDFSAQSSISVDSEYGSYVADGITCTAGEVFDPFTNRCLQVTCRAGFTLQGSKCVAPSTGCDGSVIQVPLDVFCLCKLEEQWMLIEYHYNGDVNLTSVDQLTDDLNLFEVKHTKQYTQLTNVTIVTISIEAMRCQLLYKVSDLVIRGINNTDGTRLTRVTIKQICLTTGLPIELLCDVETVLLTNGFFKNFDQTTRLIGNATDVPEDGYVLETIYRVANASRTCISLSVSTCNVCPHVQMDASAFVEDNGTLLHVQTGEVFGEHAYAFVNSSNTSSVLVCSASNNVGLPTPMFNHSGYRLIMSVVGTSISLVCLLLTILLRLLVPELLTLSGKIIVNISLSLFCALLLTMFQGNFVEWPTACEIVAATLHYLWLVCFLWMNAMAFELFRTFRLFRASPRSKKSQKNSFTIYIVYSWGIPAAYVAVLVGLIHCECTGFNMTYGDDSVCWIRNEVASFYVFGIPLAVILLPNLILFSATITGIREARQSTAVVSGDKSKQKQLTEEMVIYIRISTVMGLSWILGLNAPFVDHVIIWDLYVILNSLQGFFIFVAFNMTHSIKRILTSRKKKQTMSASQRTTRDTSLSTISSPRADKIMTS